MQPQKKQISLVCECIEQNIELRALEQLRLRKALHFHHKLEKAIAVHHRTINVVEVDQIFVLAEIEKANSENVLLRNIEVPRPLIGFEFADVVDELFQELTSLELPEAVLGAELPDLLLKLQVLFHLLLITFGGEVEHRTGEVVRA